MDIINDETIWLVELNHVLIVYKGKFLCEILEECVEL